ncbi:glutamine--tRNA ligase/YqeY domain fusion protein [Portibacter marinus]|uniref:glutamine--tRNA ligase/YqeY domain fusion protein n=1 Tax=Portibacter marinus TaxID=2898660 RepID=UPI001F3793C9|nr:glutamine--tRNA ligase/YqeY domain fusion protein [Portibacter marinus]
MAESLNFIEQIVEEDIASGKHNGHVHTRFPPEPNGFLHIGHTKAICINFETAEKYGGITNLRFDDTNPETEETMYVDAIQRDIKWLGFDWENRLYFASDYFGQLYEFALQLIKDGYAYVDDSTPEEIAEMKGTPTQPGVDSPYRKRSVEENLKLFQEMKAGVFPDGSKVLRAKIDMSSPNMLMRDPVMYRIKHAGHHRTGDAWCIYPMYDFAHGQSDAIEHITHSLCSLEFIHHRPLYNWFIDKLGIYPSRQIEFARMNVEYMITSKRKLLKLVEEGLVSGWDDARMPTLAGMRRKGYPPKALRVFCDKAGVAKRENLIEMELLESCVRDELNRISNRVHVVIDPLKVIITNYPEGKTEEIEAINNPEDDNSKTRMIPFSREIYIEKADFMIDPPKKFFRMGPGRDVRLKNGYILHCEDYKMNEASGEIEEVYCTYYENSKSGEDTSGVRAKGTLHYVSIAHAKECELRLLDHLFTDPTPDGHEDRDFLDFYNKDSMVIKKAYMEPALDKAKVGQYFQFMRNAYFTLDPDATPDKKIFNRTVTLKSSWKKK